jgi:hypothetical protein
MRASRRKESDESKLIQGRLAERWSVDGERKFLSALNILEQPVWVALEGDWHGYDIKSYRPTETGSLRTVLIEVKSFSHSNTPQFYLTRHEWDKALQSPEAYMFHIWCVEEKQRRVLSVKEVLPQIPQDRHLGEWQVALILLST